MKIIAISDLHGYLPTIEEQADIMLIAGDISPLQIQGTKTLMKEWMIDSFIPWINKLKVEKVFLVGGNHDFLLNNASHTDIAEWKMLTSQKLVLLNNETTTYIDNNGISWTIFGTPYCHIFGNWPFMLSDEALAEKFKEIPEEVDIIISHDPPFNVNFVDCTLQIPYSRSMGPEHKGNKPLREQLEKTKFRLGVFGHIHSSDHNPTEFMGATVVGVSLLDEYYQPVYEPLILELEKWDTL